ncbi:M56 family metallopeptidase [Salinimicrobium oceani]|uniref:TonB-dependent receptor plug domain-containing protein n=1 Tax=Salinimicrobium oceani TaxID=2722702 RepID=A0ABX1CZP8_9FLAO|nr:M56 family metallopeptidase [Salinimicrobium oceani]NJW53734.1 TonB-dependent receptor plug domain-containing protein [Salinimicrobium oceani]
MMQDLIIYLLKSAGLLSIFFLGYFFLLKNDTSFNANRFFLLAGIFTSLLLPFLEITRTVEVETTAAPLLLENFSAEINPKTTSQTQSTDWWLIAGIIYLLGCGFFLLRFIRELFSLLYLITTHKNSRKENFFIINKEGITQPFAFFNYIVLDPSQHSALELELILKHEMSHARQWHSIDQLISSLSTYMLWFNPFTWFYRKSLVQNLEFLADKEVVAAKVSKKEYQKTLLKISVSGFEPALTNQFYQPLIKKRIMMINKNPSRKSHFWKTGLLLPFLAFFIFSFNIKTEAMEVPAQQEQVTTNELTVYITKETDKKALRAYKRLFKQEGVELTFKNPQYSEGFLINIEVSFKKASSGATGSLSLNNPNGISPLLIQTNGKEVTMSPQNSVPKQPDNPLAEIGKSPLYVLSGKEYKSSQLINKHLEVKGDWQVLQPKEARKKYGAKAKDGAIIIPHENIVEDFKATLKDIDLSQMPMKKIFIHVLQDQPPVLMGVDSKVTVHGSSKPTAFEQQEISFHKKPEDIIAVEDKNEKSQKLIIQESKPLIVIDGQLQKEGFDVSTLDPSSIKNLMVLKGNDATKKYGQKGKNGVIEIELRSQEELKRTSQEDKNGEDPSKSIKFSVSTITSSDYSERKTLSVRDVGSADPDASKPLYVVDGKEMPEDFNPNSISNEIIESLTVLKGENATDKYGEKASKGVIEIITRK